MVNYYAPLPNPRPAPDAERELNDAFESDHEEDAVESTPLTHRPSNYSNDLDAGPTSSLPGGAYDFEREYDYVYGPPPGSPPRPSAMAIPNDYGNSNGFIPSEPVQPPMPRMSLFRRAAGAILPSHYVRVPTNDAYSRTIGGGADNDGVFANVMAKPSRAVTVTAEDGSTHVVPEESQKEAPPTYASAQADAVPPYWENTVHAPISNDPSADLFIEDLPSGSWAVFGFNLVISFFFQFVGFLLTYLLHSSHAAKFGARAGLGLTLIQFGYYSNKANSELNESDDQLQAWDPTAWPVSPEPSTDPSAPNASDVSGTLPPSDLLSPNARVWLSFMLMTIGWVLLLSSLFGFWRIKRWESSIRSAATASSTDQTDGEASDRRSLFTIFGIPLSFFRSPFSTSGSSTQPGPVGIIQRDERGAVILIPAEQLLEEERLHRDLAAAGLL